MGCQCSNIISIIAQKPGNWIRCDMIRFITARKTSGDLSQALVRLIPFLAAGWQAVMGFLVGNYIISIIAKF